MSVILRVDCKPSAALSAAVLLVHMLAAVCACLALPPAALYITLAGLLLSGFGHWQQVRLRHPLSVLRLEWTTNGLRTTGPSAITEKPRFLGGAALGPWLAFLQAQYQHGRTAHILIPSDAAEAQSFRRLRVWLRWHPPDDA